VKFLHHLGKDDKIVNDLLEYKASFRCDSIVLNNCKTLLTYHFAVKDLIKSIPDFHIHVLHAFIAGKTVWVHYAMSGTFSGNDAYNIKANHRRFESCGIWQFTCTGGKITGGMNLFDHQAFHVQLGWPMQEGVYKEILSISQ